MWVRSLTPGNNRDEWTDVEATLAGGEIDILLISPECPAKLAGRLAVLQGACAKAHRRMSEICGGREGTRRTTSVVIQSQASWSAVQQVGKRVTRLAPIAVTSDEPTDRLIETALRCVGQLILAPALPLLPVLLPFTLPQPLVYVISNGPPLQLPAEGPGGPFVALRALR